MVTLTDGEKTMRELKTKETPILSGYRIFHNYIRPHESSNGRTFRWVTKHSLPNGKVAHHQTNFP